MWKLLMKIFQVMSTEMIEFATTRTTYDALKNINYALL